MTDHTIQTVEVKLIMPTKIDGKLHPIGKTFDVTPEQRNAWIRDGIVAGEATADASAEADAFEPMKQNLMVETIAKLKKERDEALLNARHLQLEIETLRKDLAESKSALAAMMGNSEDGAADAEGGDPEAGKDEQAPTQADDAASETNEENTKTGSTPEPGPTPAKTTKKARGASQKKG